MNIPSTDTYAVVMARPQEFVATQSYSPCSSGNTSLILSVQLPLLSCDIIVSWLVSMICWLRYHSIEGSGTPTTTHCICSVSPSIKLIELNIVVKRGDMSCYKRSSDSFSCKLAVDVTEPPTFSARHVYVPTLLFRNDLIIRMDLLSCVTMRRSFEMCMGSD